MNRIRLKYRIGVSMVLWISMAAAVSAQTGGGSDLSSIESKANRILSLQEKIEDLKKEITKQELEKEVMIESARQRLADKLEEIENSESWKNRRESARSGWEENSPGTCSAGGPPPICTADHWHRVPSSVAWEKYEEYRDGVLEEYHERIRNAGKAQEGKIADASSAIEQALDDIERLKREIVAHSSDYKENVVKTGKSRHSGPIRELMRLLAEKHNLEDRIDVYNVKLKELDEEEDKTVKEAREKISLKIDGEKAKLQDRIDENKSRLQRLFQAQQERTSSLQNELRTWKSDLFQLELLLRDTSKLKVGEYPLLIAQQKQLGTQIREGEERLLKFRDEFQQQETTIKEENTVFSDKIWDYTANLSHYQDKAVLAIEDAFTSKRTILHQGKEARIGMLRQKAELLAEKTELARQDFMTWASQVDQERVKLMKECQKVGCSCYGSDTYGTIVLNWNNSYDCVDTMDASRYGSVGIYGCSEESADYHQFYAALKGNLSDSDLAALRRSITKSRYDLMYNTLID
ncbi:hypothetical protein LZF95_02035 [Algoriphagus sp. AGSA1]|uniref:hypothetical protein n=1 Tax=Algoriphagus sp. AGSA1 TaxID=2907213 RepID=UPI001F3D2FC2|nr:hypothetical protein [Algoriphagus sp. AGSA1]MCE7053439.1 hypothetical protein [Algoriphagus sp. AGSA1]